MNIVYVAALDPDAFEGGTERVVRAHAAALAARGHVVRLVTGSAGARSSEDVERGDVDGVPLARVPRESNELPADVLERPRVGALVEQEIFGADVVHVHGWSTLTLDLVRRCAASARVVVTLHDHFASCARTHRVAPVPGLACPAPGTAAREGDATCARCLADGGPERGAERWLEPLARRRAHLDAELRAAALLLAPSAAHARACEALAGLAPGAVRVLPHGLCRTLPAAPERSPSRGELRVLHFGNLVHEKGTLDLVHSLYDLPSGLPLRLTLAGPILDPDLRPELEAAVGAVLERRARGARVERVGSYDSAALAALAADADVAAFPSRVAESYGLVLDEAQALGLPALVADRGALPERLGGAGRVLPAADPGAWGRALAELASAPHALDVWRSWLPTSVFRASDAARELEAHYRALVEAGRPA